MPTVLLVLTTPDGMEAAARRAAEEAGETGRVVIAHIADVTLGERVARRIADEGFVGLRQEADVAQSLATSADEHGGTLLAETRALLAAAAPGLTLEDRRASGCLENEILVLAEDLRPACVVMPCPRRRGLARFLGEPCAGRGLDRRLSVPVIRVEY
jgi:hypothetical protein